MNFLVQRWLLALVLVTIPGARAYAGHKIQVNDRSAADEAIAQGGQLIADYGSYQLFELDQPAPKLTGQRGVENRDYLNHIELDAIDIDTTQPEAKALRKSVGQFKGKRMQLV